MTKPRPITDSSAWTVADGGAEGITRRLGPQVLDAIAAAADASASVEPVAITRDMFAAQPIVELMAAVRHDIFAGRGVALLSGLDIDTLGEEAFTRIHFGLGTHLGTAAPQSPRRDRIGYVQKEPNPDLRGYLMDTELGPHTDFHEVLSLATVQTADSGGLSGFVSSSAIFNALLAEDPEAVDALMAGHPYPAGRDSVTDYAVPSFSLVDGHLGLYNYALFPFEAARIMGADLPPPDLVAAMRALGAVARRPELMVSFQMQPGEMVFWHNFKVQHSRTAFVNGTRKRKLLRLWLHAHRPMPMARGFLELARLLDEHHEDGRAMLVNSEDSLRTVYQTLARGG